MPFKKKENKTSKHVVAPFNWWSGVIAPFLFLRRSSPDFGGACLTSVMYILFKLILLILYNQHTMWFSLYS